MLLSLTYLNILILVFNIFLKYNIGENNTQMSNNKCNLDMGVFIYPCKIKDKVSDLVSNEEYDALIEKYEAMGVEILPLEEMNEYDKLIPPFEEGIYIYEGGKSDVDMSYGTNGDFLQQLERMGEDNNDCNAFSTTLSASGIDNCVSYAVAEEMLEEFEKYKDKAEKHFMKWSNDEYGEFMWGVYKRYIEVLKECIELKGVVRYH